MTSHSFENWRALWGTTGLPSFSREGQLQIGHKGHKETQRNAGAGPLPFCVLGALCGYGLLRVFRVECLSSERVVQPHGGAPFGLELEAVDPLGHGQLAEDIDLEGMAEVEGQARAQVDQGGATVGKVRIDA